MAEKVKKVNLLDLTKNLRSLQEALETAEDDQSLLEALNDTMEGAVGEFEDKAVAVLQACKYVNMPVEGLKQEMSRISDRIKAIENNTKRLRRWLLENMLAAGIEKIEHPLVTISIRKGTMQFEVDENEVPEEYLLPPEVKIKVDRSKIREAIKHGAEIEGVKVYTSEPSLLVR